MTDARWGSQDGQGEAGRPGSTETSLSSAGPARQRVLDQIEIWRKELVNLARSNRLLYFRHTKSATLEIVREPDQIEEVVAELLAGRSWRFYVPPEHHGDAENTVAGESAAVVGSELLDIPAPDQLLTTKPDGRSLHNALRLLERRATQSPSIRASGSSTSRRGFCAGAIPTTRRGAIPPGAGAGGAAPGEL